MRKPKSEAAHGWDREECFQEENSMSSPITPSPSTAGTGPVLRAAAASRPPGVAPTIHAAAASGPSVSLNAIPSSPPQEVLDQMAGAAQVYEHLSSQGRELRFAHDHASGRIKIEVCDRGGNVLKQLSPAQALDLAAGAPLE
jgi:hypothetical protein